MIIIILFRFFCYRVLQDETTGRDGDLYIRSVSFSPDGKYLATGAEDKQIRVMKGARRGEGTHLFTHPLFIGLGYWQETHPSRPQGSRARYLFFRIQSRWTYPGVRLW